MNTIAKGSIGLLMMLLASVSWAAPLVSDPFLLSGRDGQWTNYVNNGVLSQGDGKLNASHSTTSGDRWAGYKSATGYVLSGDFDIQINFEASSSAISATGDGVYGRFLIASVDNPGLNIDVRNSRSFGYFDNDWLMLALINDGHLSRPENLRGYPAAALRAVRIGSALYAYGRPMQQGPNGLLVPVGDGEWTLIQSIPSGFTGDATVSFFTGATGNGIITSTWQDFKIAHRALVSDDFQASTQNEQWTRESISATLYQGYGKVYASPNAIPGDRWAGYKSTTDYVLSGDFDVRINFDAYASAVGATNDAVYGRFLVSSIRGGARNIDIRNSRSFGYFDNDWLMLALINDGHLSRPENLRGYSAVAFRAVRKGTTLYAYGRPMQQGPNNLLVPVGDGEWTLIQSLSNCFTEEATVSFITYAAGNGTIGSTWQNFEIFVETTAAPEFSPAGPEIAGPTEVTIGCATEGASICYTTDGSTPATYPTDSTSHYTGPVTVTPGMTLSAIAVKAGYRDSAVTRVSYMGSIVSDDFQSDTRGAQWALKSLNPTHLYQGWKRVYTSLTGAGQRWAGYQSAPNYVLKGDFDVRVNFHAYASTVTGSGDVVYGRFLITSVDNPGLNIDVRNSRSFGYFDNDWLMLALINDGHLSRPENLRGYPAVAFRAVRKGNTLYAYGRPMQQAPNGLLAPVGDGEWTLIQSITTGFTDDVTVSFFTGAEGNATIGATWQAFDRFVESAAAPMPNFSPAYSVISGPRPITITSSLPDAVIRYTLDGSEPTEENGTEIASGETVSIATSGTTLNARVWADGLDPSPVRSVTYTFATSYNRPEVIAHDQTIVVDGDLSDWPAADFVPLDTPYDGDGASDVIDACYAAKWSSTGKIYVAVKVTDLSQHLVDEYEGWDKSDTVEIYLHTQGTTDKYVASDNWDHNWESAQQYITGLRTDGGSVWTTLGGNTSAAPAVAGIVADGSRSGAIYMYEYELTPYDSFGGWFGGPSVVSTLAEGDVIGLDICVSSTDSEGNFLGMISENNLPEKEEYVSSIAIHRLGPEVHYIPGDANKDGVVSFEDFAILQNHYGQSGMTWTKGDFNGDGWVTFADFAMLQNHYGQGQSGSGSSAAAALATGSCGMPGLMMLTVIGLSLLFLRNQE